MSVLRLLFATALAAVASTTALAQPLTEPIPQPGEPVQFVGRVIVEWEADGRTVRLLEPYSYIDPHGEVWDVPPQTIVDGASIPQIFWGIIGGPMEGKYRNASIIHDYYCDQKTRPWQQVHRVFYDAMIESGVEFLRAKTMYYAVYVFGPRWETIETDVVSLNCTADGTCAAETLTLTTVVELPPAAYDADKVQADISMILATNPSLEEIEALAVP